MDDWKSDLDDYFSRQEQLERAEEERQARERQAAETFLTEIVVPAFRRVGAHMELHGREVKIASGADQATITVIHRGSPEIMYRIYADRPQPTAEYAFIASDSGRAVKAADAITAEEGPLAMDEITQEVIIRHFIRKYKSVGG